MTQRVRSTHTSSHRYLCVDACLGYCCCCSAAAWNVHSLTRSLAHLPHAGVAHEIKLHDVDANHACSTTSLVSPVPVGPGYVGQIRNAIGGGVCHAAWERASAAVLEFNANGTGAYNVAHPRNGVGMDWLYQGVDVAAVQEAFPDFGVAPNLRSGSWWLVVGRSVGSRCLPLFVVLARLVMSMLVIEHTPSPGKTSPHCFHPALPLMYHNFSLVFDLVVVSSVAGANTCE